MNIRFLLVSVTAGMLLAFTPLATAAEAGKAKDKSETYKFLNLFGDVFERVRADYVEETTDEALIEAAISGMLTSLDPHSAYLNARSFRDMQVETKGQFGGLGIEVTMENQLVKVISPIDDTPAFRAGIQPGDFITHLNGEPVLGLNLSEAVEKMRGPVGTDIKLTIKRGTREPFDVTLTRAIVKIESVKGRLEGNIGYLRVSRFSEQTDVSLKKAIAKIREEAGDKLQGVVLDLRNNPGGLLDQAVAVADVFLDKGEIVSTRSKKPEEAQRFNARPGDAVRGLPVVVLINGGSASASEIVAGALQDHRRALLLGTKSFGKGSVQTIIQLAGHGAMRLTTARYYTPSGRSIQALGIEPDIMVEQAKIESLQTATRPREADLRGALERRDEGPAEPQPRQPDVKNGDKGAAPAADAQKAQDYQLSRALDLLRGVALFGARNSH
jgi:carboxyl-terminal processing protease